MSDLTSIIQSLNTSAAKASQYTELLKQVAAGDKDTTVDIDGELIPTLSRIADLTLQALNDLQYQVLGDYAGGIEITNFGQVVRESGEFYRLKADQTLPYTTTGTWVGDDENRFVSVGDGVLRQDLVQPVATYDSVADMQADPFLTIGRKVRTLGYYGGWAATINGPSGGNDYEIVAAGTGTDDGGSFIDLSGSGLQAKGLFVDGVVKSSQFGTIGDGLNDDAFNINRAITYCSNERIGEIKISGGGLVLTAMSTIRLKRGVSVVGESNIDDTSGTIIKRGDNLNGPVFATDKWFDPMSPVDTHYYVVKNLTILGNKGNQTERHPAIAFWGVFVGSKIEDVLILENYGSGISFEYAFDCYLNNIWVNLCNVGASGASIEINQTATPAGPIGLIDIGSIYLENQRVSEPNGIDPAETFRGTAIKMGNVGKLSIQSIHCEGAEKVVHVTAPVDNAYFGNMSLAFCGDSSRDNASFYFESGNIGTLEVSSIKGFNLESGFYWSRPTLSVSNGSQVPTIQRVGTKIGGFSINATSDKPFITNEKVYGSLDKSAMGLANSFKTRVFTSESNPVNYHYEQGLGAFWNFGSKHDQASEKVFTRIESYGNAGDRITDFVPRVVPTFDTVSVNNAFYVTSGGDLRIRIGGVEYSVSITPV